MPNVSDANVAYKSVSASLDVPPETGIEGFLLAIRGLFKLPRLQGFNVDRRGKVSYTYVVRKEEEESAREFRINFSEVAPFAIIRNSGEVRELEVTDPNAAVAIGQLFYVADIDRFFPCAFVMHTRSEFWDWYKRTTRLSYRIESLFGLPVYKDENIDPFTVVLCTSYEPHADLIYTARSYKLNIPRS